MREFTVVPTRNGFRASIHQAMGMHYIYGGLDLGCVPPHIPFLHQSTLRTSALSGTWRASVDRYLSALLHI